MQHLRILLFIVCLVVGANGWRPAGETRPNFVFWFPDTTRAESMGTYGHPLTQTPNWSRLYTNGTRFTNAHVQHTQCTPSRCALASGRYMHVEGHRTQAHLLQTHEDNLFKYLKNAGYTVQWYGKNDMLENETFYQSVSTWGKLTGYPKGNPLFNYGQAGYWSFLYNYSTNAPTKSGDYTATQHAISFIQSDPKEPWMVFLPHIGSHPPYGGPQEYYNMYNIEDIKRKAPLRPKDMPGKPEYHSTTQGIPYWRNLSNWDEDYLYKVNAVYLGSVSYDDYVLGTLLDAVWGTPSIAKNTVIIASSDHGDFAGDHHMVEKWPGGMDDVLTRVPLLISMPGGATNHTVNEPVAVFDIMPTILELANITPNGVMFAESLVPQLTGQNGDPSRFVYSEGGFYYTLEVEPTDPSEISTYNNVTGPYYPRGEEELLPNGIPRCVMARNMTHKIVYRSFGTSELYDLVLDPTETTNVYYNDAYLDVKIDLLNMLVNWFVETGDVTPTKYDSRATPPDPTAAP